MEGDYLFVYGSLRPAARGTGNISGADRARELLTEDRHEGAATMPGQLISLGLYPGWLAPERVPGSLLSGEVQGDVYRVDDGILACLDVYEGCSVSCPPPHEYRRRKAKAKTVSDSEIDVWVYEYVGLEARMGETFSKVPSNDWLEM
jgi:gamma-glutamylcyclotransferase (GGCT)/AIG2-like uncharacterized protein YtfP